MREFLRKHFGGLSVLLLVLGIPGSSAQDRAPALVLTVDAAAPSRPFAHFWEQMFGSGRAILSLRESYRSDLRQVKQITDFEYIRFHNILHDEVGVYDEDGQGHPVYNFSYVDQIYDGLLANGLKPFVELSFMPNKLAAAPILHAFWYKPNVSPPKDWNQWDDLITVFTRHLVDRYGVDQVATWYFEVWNEPNLDFWAGEPKQATYWQLYDHTATAIKKVNSRLRVGGPATAQSLWVDAFIQHCVNNKIPLDFVSTHVYANDPVKNVFGTEENVPRDRLVCRAVSKVHDQIKASALPKLPLIWSEFNASYRNEPAVTDSVFMGPWLADTIRQCDGLVDSMAYWTFSDVFEEQGVVKTPFYGGYGLMAAGGIPKPAYEAFKILHKLGRHRIALDSDSALLTRSDSGALDLAVWNYAPPEDPGLSRTVTVRFENTKPQQVLIWRVDASHGDIHPLYEKMGAPRYPSQEQVRQLREAAENVGPDSLRLNHGEVAFDLPAHGLAVIEVR